MEHRARLFRSHAISAGWEGGELERALAEPGQPLPPIDFVPRVQSCPVCAEPLGVYKTWRRVATVRDLGGGMAAAVAPLRKRGIADLVCHQHSLKAVGTKLMETAYDRLRALLKGIGLRAALVELRRELRPFVGDAAPGAQSARDRVRKELPALVHWLLQGEGKKELPFPFALHHLDRFLRCRAFPELVEQWLPRPWSAAERKSVGRLESLVRKLHKDPRFA